jgi:hypothetical protein
LASPQTGFLLLTEGTFSPKSAPSFARQNASYGSRVIQPLGRGTSLKCSIRVIPAFDKRAASRNPVFEDMCPFVWLVMMAASRVGLCSLPPWLWVSACTWRGTTRYALISPDVVATRGRHHPEFRVIVWLQKAATDMAAAPALFAVNRNVEDVKSKASKYTKLHEFGAWSACVA